MSTDEISLVPGLVVASLVKEIQITSELRKMAELDLVPPATVERMIRKNFEYKLPKNRDDDDPLLKGEFDVIKELLDKVRSLFDQNWCLCD